MPVNPSESTPPYALVTGASAGIGRDLAHGLARRGFHVILTARREAELQALAQELQNRYGGQHPVIPADLSQPDAPKRLADQVQAAYPLQMLVNNAGFGVYGPFAAASTEALLDMVRVNVLALTELTRRFLPGMLERRKGAILNVASIAGFQPGPQLAAYGATKAYVRSLTEALSEELRGSGVTATALCPGPVQTEFATVAGMADSALFSGPSVRPSQEVAERGIRAALRGERIAIPGFLNRLLITAGYFTPQPLLLRAVNRAQSARKNPPS